MNSTIYANVSGGGTLTIPAISGTVFPVGATVQVTNYSASTMAISTTPTVNAGGGCVTGTGIPAQYTWSLQSNGTTIDCAQVSNLTLGTGVGTALAVNVGSAGAVVVNGGAGGTPSSLVLTNATGLPSASVGAAPLTAGTSITLSAPRGYAICSGTCTVTVPVPAAGYEFCAFNKAGVSTAITISNPGSGTLFAKTDGSGYGTATTGTLAATAAAGNRVCIVGGDATHYEIGSSNGTWSNS
jgi:hypothetical protein